VDDDVMRIVATAAAGLIIRAVGTAAWTATRDLWARVFSKGDRDREGALAERLDESSRALVVSDPDSRPAVAREIEMGWREELLKLLRDDPDLVDEVRSLALADLPTVDESARTGVQQRARVRRGVVVQSGRDTSVGSC
jgi:hypothetical protein